MSSVIQDFIKLVQVIIRNYFQLR